MSTLDIDLLLRAGLGLVLVIGLILIVAAVLRRVTQGGGGGLMRRGPRRLAMVESLTLDPKRRLVLVRRDGCEHLLLLGAGADLVVETGIHPPAPAPAAAQPGSSRHPLGAMVEPSLNDPGQA